MARLSGAERTRRWRERKAREAAEAAGETAPVVEPDPPSGKPAASLPADAAGEAPSALAGFGPRIHAALDVDDEELKKLPPADRVKVMKDLESARAIWIKNEKVAGQFVNREEARIAWSDALTGLRERLFSLPAEVASKLGAVIAITDEQQEAISQMFDERIREALDVVSRTSPPRRAA